MVGWQFIFEGLQIINNIDTSDGSQHSAVGDTYQRLPVSQTDPPEVSSGIQMLIVQPPLPKVWFSCNKMSNQLHRCKTYHHRTQIYLVQTWPMTQNNQSKTKAKINSIV